MLYYAIYIFIYPYMYPDVYIYPRVYRPFLKLHFSANCGNIRTVMAGEMVGDEYASNVFLWFTAKQSTACTKYNRFRY